MLPVIDLSRFADGTPAARLAIADEIGRACQSMGFFYVAGHGVSPGVIEDSRALAQAFFALPRADKMRCARRPGEYRGYIPVSAFTEPAEGRPPIHYEAFLVGAEIAEADPAVAASRRLLVPNLWPTAPQDFRRAMLAYQAGVGRIADHLLQAFSLALGGVEDRFAGLFNRPLSNLSLLHYLARPDSGSDAPDDARAHHDTNALTVLLPGSVGGLEAQTPDGDWLEVPPLDGCFVVNIGNMMACWSGGRFKSTLHRVHPPLGIDRYSIGYFAVPDHDVTVTPLDPTAISDPRACAPIHAGRDLADFVARCDAMVPVEA